MARDKDYWNVFPDPICPNCKTGFVAKKLKKRWHFECEWCGHRYVIKSDPKPPKAKGD